jgi:hypothetical protein
MHPSSILPQALIRSDVGNKHRARVDSKTIKRNALVLKQLSHIISPIFLGLHIVEAADPPAGKTAVIQLNASLSQPEPFLQSLHAQSARCP